MPDEGVLLYEASYALISIGWIILLVILLFLLYFCKNKNKPPKRSH